MARARGSTRPGFLELGEAARKVSMSQRSLRILVLAGQVGGFKEGKTWWVSGLDVERISKGTAQEVSIETANRRAAAALVMAEQAYLRVQELMELAKMDQGGVPIDSIEIKAWYQELRAAGEHNIVGIVTDPAESMRWAKYFIAVTESFLDLLELETGDPHSWARLYCFSRDLRDATHLYAVNSERLTRAHNLIHTGYSVVRSTAYFWLCSRNGAEFAAKMFPETRGNIDEGLVAIILDHANGLIEEE